MSNIRSSEAGRLAAAWPQVSADIARLQGAPSPPRIYHALPPGTTTAGILARRAVGHATIVSPKTFQSAVELARRHTPNAAYATELKSGSQLIVERVR